jgi:hypothetical protein
VLWKRGGEKEIKILINMKFRLAARFLPIHPRMRVLGMIPATKLRRMVLMERETHIDKESGAQVNVVMTAIRHDTIQKEIFVECKRSKPKGIKPPR